MPARRPRRLPRFIALLALPVAACAGGSGGGASPPDPDAGPHAAMETITAQDIAREVGVLAHDSMAGRDTPSPELEAAAEYLADRFGALGLEPAGDGGTYIHRWDYEVHRLDPAGTGVAVAGEDLGLRYGRDYFLVPGMRTVSAKAVYIGEAGDARITADNQGDVLVVDHPGEELDEAWQETLMTILQPAAMVGPAALVVILDPAFPAEMMEQLARLTAGQRAPFPVLGVTSAAAERLVARAGGELPALRAAGEAVRPGEAAIEIRWDHAARNLAQPNVVAMLPGSDPALRDTYVVISAHFDHVGIGSPDETGDSIYNGADDNASGTAAVVEMAGAFAALDRAPARSVIFLLVSGEEKGLLGAMAYAEDPPGIGIGDVVANVNLDMVGRNEPDTIIGIGQEYSTLQDVLDEIQDHHPELGLDVILDPVPEKNFFFRSDQLAFIQQGIPAVFFTNDDHEDYHRPSDEAEKLDNDKVAKVARLGFLLAYHIAQDPDAPRWTPEGRERIEGMLQRSPF